MSEFPERFVILSELGRGAMGVVYLARDRQLGREVAIKVVSPAGAGDPQRLARLRREARILASLNHPNIAALHDVVEHEGQVLLVLEYVAGTTLAARLRASGPSRTELLDWFRQLAEGIEAAHARGIVHRDLKPSNVALTPDGAVKILDFGLGKLARPEASEDDPMAPSGVELELTHDGDVLGTTAYMSPEQLRGAAVDRRADVWAFGCLLYEALTGARAFPGETRADIIASVLDREPDLGALPPDLGMALRDLVSRCLEKDPRFRLRDIGEAWVRLVRLPSAPPVGGAGPLRSRILTGVMLLVGVVGLVWVRSASHSGAPDAGADPWFTITPDKPMVLAYTDVLALSPQGDAVAYVASQGTYLRRLASLQSDSLPVPRGARGLFFSPDGRSLGFDADDSRLHRYSLIDGTCSDMVNAPDARGASWGPDDSVVFAPSFNSGLWKGPAGPGAARPITVLDSTRGEVTHRWPEVLPDGRAALFTIRRREQLSFDQAEIAVVDLRTGRRWTLLEGGSCAHFLAPDRLVFVRDSMLRVAPFDARRLRVTGPARPTGIRIASSAPTGVGQFALARDGTLAYAPRGDLMRGGERVYWIDRQGRQLDSLELDVRCENPVPSPDGSRIAFTLVGAQNDVAVADRNRRTITRLTFSPDEDAYPIWTRDGRQVTFASSRSGALNLYNKPADGNGPVTRLTFSTLPQEPCDWSPDGHTLYFTQDSPETRSDLWALTLPGGRCEPVLATRANEREARVSPDGHWLAYESDESGRSEVYVGSLPGLRERWQISTHGGAAPRWSSRPGELLFQDRDLGIVVVSVVARDRFHVENLHTLFRLPYDRLDLAFAPNADVFLARAPDPGLPQLVVASRWGAHRNGSASTLAGPP
jgi:serine/threonine protein kinase/Tol biopolymer transport system component